MVKLSSMDKADIADIKDKRLLAVFAHPDDESFCCGGSLRKVAEAGVKIHLLCATRGEDGEWHRNPFVHKDVEKEKKLAKIRMRELKKAAEILGIKKVEYLDFVDGLLNNRDLNSGRLQKQIAKKIVEFKPEVVLTFDRSGISGHLDHIAVSYATTAVVKKQASVTRLYYCTAHTELIDRVQQEKPDFPSPLVEVSANVVKYDISDTWKEKKRAVMAHKTQKGDWERLIPIWESLPKFEYYKLAIERKPERVNKVPFF